MKTTKNTIREGKVVSKEMYNGSVTVEYDDGTHRYSVNGKRVPLSVSGIVGDNTDGLIMWACSLNADRLEELADEGEIIDQSTIRSNVNYWKDKRQELADIGSEVHNWIEQYVKGNKPKEPTDERVFNGVLAFLAMVKSKGIKFVENEKIIYSKKHGYIGIMDCVFTMESEDHKIFHAGDFKTGKPDTKKLVRGTKFRAWEKDRYQLAGYQFADMEESGREYGNGWLFYINRDSGVFNAVEIKDQADDWTAFKCRLFVKNREIKLKKLDWQ
jgi:hypothetical protein